MPDGPHTIFWRSSPAASLERLTILSSATGVAAEAITLNADATGHRLNHHWELSRDWSVRRCRIEKNGVGERNCITLERQSDSWLVGGRRRADLDGAAEPDLSATPFCNSFPIRRMLATGEARLLLDTVFLDASSMTVERSRQEYRRIGESRFHYVDHGTAAGFEAEITVDGQGLVVTYEGLFERALVAPEEWLTALGDSTFRRPSTE